MQQNVMYKKTDVRYFVYSIDIEQYEQDSEAQVIKS